MSNISLKLDKRTAEGKKVAKLRNGGFIPSVVYGGQAEPLMTQSAVVETTKAVHHVGKHTPLDLIIDGHKKLAIVKSIDMDPVKHLLRHIAFHTIKQNDIITTEVPIVLIGQGESAAERAGLVILQAIEHLEIKAKPADLPESLEISIIDLATDEDKLTVGDIKLPAGVEYADVDQDLNLVIANVYEPSALQSANEAAGGDAEEDTIVDAELTDANTVGAEAKSTESEK
jgi:large subunit ribosomal protein L25